MVKWWLRALTAGWEANVDLGGGWRHEERWAMDGGGFEGREESGGSDRGTNGKESEGTRGMKSERLANGAG